MFAQKSIFEDLTEDDIYFFIDKVLLPSGYWKLIQQKMIMSCQRKQAKNQISDKKLDISGTKEFRMANAIERLILGKNTKLTYDLSKNELYIGCIPNRIHCFDFITGIIYQEASNRKEALEIIKENIDNWTEYQNLVKKGVKQ